MPAMDTFFFRICLLSVYCLCVSMDGYSQTNANEQSFTLPLTYSKQGSDSISLIIFGKLPMNSASDKRSKVAEEEESSDKKMKKKEKFSIKSSDKLKTNSSLY